MEQRIKYFVDRLHLEGKSDKTIKQYSASLKEYFQWFYESYGDVEFKKLYRENILEYNNYLNNIRHSKRSGNNLDAKSVNSKLSALIKFNELLQADNIVISKADLIKVQTEKERNRGRGQEEQVKILENYKLTELYLILADKDKFEKYIS